MVIIKGNTSYRSSKGAENMLKNKFAHQNISTKRNVDLITPLLFLKLKDVIQARLNIKNNELINADIVGNIFINSIFLSFALVGNWLLFQSNHLTAIGSTLLNPKLYLPIKYTGGE